MKITPKNLLDANADIELMLFMSEGMTQREVADAMHITQAAVALIEKKAIHKFRQKLFAKRIYKLDWIL
jgi:transcriptional regulator